MPSLPYDGYDVCRSACTLPIMPRVSTSLLGVCASDVLAHSSRTIGARRHSYESRYRTIRGVNALHV